MTQFISGIQQVGVGVQDVREAWAWYRKNLGFNVPIFDDKSEAKLMTRYTGGVVESRHAVMALNMTGGGGLEIWQFTTRQPEACAFQPRLGDLGIGAIKIKSPHLELAHQQLQKTAAQVSDLLKNPNGQPYFTFTDPYGNAFEMVEDSSWFHLNGKTTGGVCGVTIGVSNIEKSLLFYRDVLGIDEVIFDQTGRFEDLGEFSKEKFRRILLQKSVQPQGAFSKLLGNVQIELLQAFDHQPRPIFQNRLWGDQGFIHLCFDALDMDGLKKRCTEANFPFTVDSADSFDMGQAAGRFSYVEDPDGTLIEFVETHKVPIFKKLGLYLNLKNRGHQRPLPDWMVKMMALGGVKD